MDIVELSQVRYSLDYDCVILHFAALSLSCSA